MRLEQVFITRDIRDNNGGGKPKTIKLSHTGKNGIQLKSIKSRFAGDKINDCNIFGGGINKSFVASLLDKDSYVFIFIFAEKYCSPNKGLFKADSNIIMERFREDLEKFLVKRKQEELKSQGKKVYNIKRYIKSADDYLEEWLKLGYIYNTAYSNKRYVLNPFIFNHSIKSNDFKDNLLIFFSNIFNNGGKNDYINIQEVYCLSEKEPDTDNKKDERIYNIYNWEDCCEKIKKRERVIFDYEN